jgi:hypothetical protein
MSDLWQRFVFEWQMQQLCKIRDKAERESDVRRYLWTFDRANELGRKYLDTHTAVRSSKMSDCIIYVNGEPALTRVDKRTGTVWLVKPRWHWLPVWFWRFKWAIKPIGKKGDNMVVIAPTSYDEG